MVYALKNVMALVLDVLVVPVAMLLVMLAALMVVLPVPVAMLQVVQLALPQVHMVQ